MPTALPDTTGCFRRSIILVFDLWSGELLKSCPVFNSLLVGPSGTVRLERKCYCSCNTRSRRFRSLLCCRCIHQFAWIAVVTWHYQDLPRSLQLHASGPAVPCSALARLLHFLRIHTRPAGPDRFACRARCRRGLFLSAEAWPLS